MKTILKSKTKKVEISTDGPFTIIGEKINPTGRKKLAAALQEGNLDYVRDLAKKQIEAGADVLDVNVGMAGTDDVDYLPAIVKMLAEEFDIPLCLDSPNPKALAAALPLVQGRALVNSVNGEEKSLAAVLPIVKEYGTAVIGLTIGEGGISNDPQKRLAAAWCCGLAMAAAAPAFAVHIDPAQEPETPAAPFVLGTEGYERVEFVSENFATVERISVTQAGTYAISLTDMLFPGALRKLGVAVTTAETKLVDIFGSGSALFDLQPGLYYLSLYAKPFTLDDPGLFGLTLRLQQGQTTPVPVPAALWLLGSGLIGMAGLARRKRIA